MTRKYRYYAPVERVAALVSHVLIDAELRPRAEDEGARSVRSALELVDYLRELGVRA